jgi:hypothetical protein
MDCKSLGKLARITKPLKKRRNEDEKALDDAHGVGLDDNLGTRSAEHRAAVPAE